MRRSILFVFCFLVAFRAEAQRNKIPSPDYLARSSAAFEYFLNGQYKEAVVSFDSAFNLKNAKPLAIDRFYAAFSLAMTGEKDKAMLYLERAAVLDKFADEEKYIKNSEFMKIKDHPKWKTVLTIIQKNKKEKDRKLDKQLVAQLDSIFTGDQNGRRASDSIQKKFGWDSKEMRDHWKTIQHKDSVNRNAVKNLLDKRGWLGEDVIGEKGNMTLFLVIQHSDSATQEKYLPMLRKAVSEGRAKPSQLALLEDRTRMNRREKQLYGSQLEVDPKTKQLKFYPIEDEINVNKRRASMGMTSIEQYAKGFGLQYSPPKQ